ncbi:uncharacterized protein Z520_01453 [Fonsecaea multimorphosa CBS 102226]|uniref:RecQ-mediated genome instability protein 1 n=1 Tax=Fonsecaea multimorphosa CBS 102226 TaxID=1442371 RepID=A0A0D2J0V0_9EURO|nr:uncharacterized protein Z520_01453 [Fonsecaea multimorphosa CBS 102226]KIY02987.1 hypothetical protein Z520_01453 [Fonsecaea multimorphosa CBS 102226]OAL30817.1 hypothetical protein AYO22_01437 [Fonsecaea multimorphosa]
MHPLHNQVSSALQTRHNIPVNAQWLDTFLTSRGPNPPPLPALISTAHFRILASDITTTVSPTTTAEVLPEGISDVNVKERRLEGNVIAQVLDVLDVGSSKWSQVEAIERVERGEEVRGREVIRTVNGMGNDNEDDVARPATVGSTHAPSSMTLPSSASKKLSAGPHKLLLQDARGTKVLAFELVKIPKIGLSTTASASLPPSARNLGGTAAAAIPEDPGMFIGCKLLLKPDTVVRRGMVMLTPDTCVVLGGKVEAWDKKWKEERKQRLTALVREENAAGGS